MKARREQRELVFAFPIARCEVTLHTSKSTTFFNLTNKHNLSNVKLALNKLHFFFSAWGFLFAALEDAAASADQLSV